MNKRQKIGWLVLGIAILFMLWRLPRLHGQGFGSFSHDQPFLAKDAASSTSIPYPPTANLAAWWHWEDVTVSGTNWVDRVNSNAWTSSGTSTPTNDGTGLYFDGVDDVMTNLTFTGNFDTLWWRGVSVYVVASSKGKTNASTLFCSSGVSPYKTMLFASGSSQTSTNMGITSGPNTMFTNIISGNLFGLSWSLEGNFAAMDCYLDGVLERTIANVYEHGDDNHYLGNKYSKDEGWHGWVYDILVYTNVFRWTTNTTPTLASIYQWQTNWYNKAVTITSPTNIPNMYPVAWYVADDGLTTNASTVSWADHSAQSRVLSNSAAAGMWPTVTNSALNGHKLICFDGVDDWMSSVLVSNTQPTEYVLVLSHDGNVAGANKVFYDGYYTTEQNLSYFDFSSKARTLYAGGSLVPSRYIQWTNTWWICNDVFNNWQTTLYTNNVAFFPTAIGAGRLHGITFAAYPPSGAGPAQIRVAEFIIYPNVLQPRYRTALYNHLKDKYGL